MSARGMKKRKTTLARQLKVKRQEDSFDTFQDSSFDVVACAADIKTNMSNHRRALESNLQACTAALDDMESIDDHADVRDKIRQLEYMYKVLNEKYNELLQYTVRLEAATELAITSRHQYALEIARGDTESASTAALMSSVHRR